MTRSRASFATRLAAAAAALSVVGLSAPPATGDALPPPPPKPCARDADCDACDVCVGATATAAGGCSNGAQGRAGCMCDADCAPSTGAPSCNLSVDKPLCG